MEKEENKKILYYPMLVSEDGSVDVMDSPKEDALWKHFRLLPKQDRDILLSSEITTALQHLQNSFRISDLSIGYISLFIRKIFFKELTMEECEAKIGSMLVTTGGGDPNQAKNIVQFIQKEILTIEPKLKTEEKAEDVPKPVTINLPILQALSQYERLGDQLITKERIHIKSQNEPVRPSIAYWIKYYRDELGVGHHDSVSLGNFLFRSDNTKTLDPSEREHISLIVKSIEENLPLAIDGERQEIVFPLSQQTKENISSVQKAIIPPSPHIPPMKPIANVAPKSNPESTGPFSFGRQFVPVQKNIKAFTTMQNPRTVQSSPQPVTNGSTMSFSTSHIFPAEKEMLLKQEKEVKKETKPTVMSAKVASSPSTKQSATTPHISETPKENAKPSASYDTNPFVIHPSQRNN